VKDRETKEPAGVEVGAIIQYAYERGLILLKAGQHGNILRFLPPLVITDDQLAEGLTVLGEAVAAVCGR
ncbi:MAG: 4-aminobutyrate--2-oxoglutarate transaminase, partial [Bacillota bacterium]|nr:4-aminobutyrate--2-oxoglutarate transaminase [Bacillota bacterium]